MGGLVAREVADRSLSPLSTVRSSPQKTIWDNLGSDLLGSNLRILVNNCRLARLGPRSTWVRLVDIYFQVEVAATGDGVGMIGVGLRVVGNTGLPLDSLCCKFDTEYRPGSST